MNGKGIGSIFAYGLFGLLLWFLIVISLYRFLADDSLGVVSFKSFLDILANAPDVDLSWSMLDLTINADWGQFDFLRFFINSFASIIEFFVYFVGLLWQLLNYIVYYVNVFFNFGINVVTSSFSGVGGGGGSSW